MFLEGESKIGGDIEVAKKKRYLQEYLGLKVEDMEKISLIKIDNLPERFRAQQLAMADKRLDSVSLAIVPDELWVKGDQPSESHADKGMILFKKSYFDANEKPDEIAWLTHELAHCQNFMDSDSPDSYQANMKKPAFNDLPSEYFYPNNPVEQHAFAKQFEFLKSQGKTREEIAQKLSPYYHKEDFSFFNRLLDEVYK